MKDLFNLFEANGLTVESREVFEAQLHFQNPDKFKFATFKAVKDGITYTVSKKEESDTYIVIDMTSDLSVEGAIPSYYLTYVDLMEFFGLDQTNIIEELTNLFIENGITVFAGAHGKAIPNVEVEFGGVEYSVGKFKNDTDYFITDVRPESNNTIISVSYDKLLNFFGIHPIEKHLTPFVITLFKNNGLEVKELIKGRRFEVVKNNTRYVISSPTLMPTIFTIFDLTNPTENSFITDEYTRNFDGLLEFFGIPPMSLELELRGKKTTASSYNYRGGYYILVDDNNISMQARAFAVEGVVVKLELWNKDADPLKWSKFHEETLVEIDE